MAKRKNIIGCRFGKLEVISFYGYNPNCKRKDEMYTCKCDCGNETIASKSHLLKGEKKSCGCMRGKNTYDGLTGKEYENFTVVKRIGQTENNNPIYKCICFCGNAFSARADGIKDGTTKSCGCLLTRHGGKGTRLYRIWIGMKSRCYNENVPQYKYYGALGVTICEEWKNDFETFRNWSLSHGYRDDLTIDRINSYGNYEPNNCRWADWKTQRNNQRKHYKQ